MAVDFSKLPIGTRVITVYGPGEIVALPRNHKEVKAFPVTVKIDKNGDVIMYKADGRYVDTHEHPTLFVAPFNWPEQEQPIDPATFKVDQPIWVKLESEGQLKWFRRHFAKYENGFVYIWSLGRTSHTVRDKIMNTQVASAYSLTDPEGETAAKPDNESLDGSEEMRLVKQYAEALLIIGAQHPAFSNNPNNPLVNLFNDITKRARTALCATGNTDDERAEWCSKQLEKMAIHPLPRKVGIFDENGTVRYRIELSNGKVMWVDERYEALHIAYDEDDNDLTWLCRIDANGINVYGNSNGATADIVKGLSA